MAGDQSFENLNHSKLISIKSKDDKEVSFQIDTWRGSTSMAIFTGAGGKPWKYPFPANFRYIVKALLEKMRAEPSQQRQPVFLNEWNQDNKKWNQVGCIAFGLDEKLNLMFDVAHNQLQGRHTFVIKPNAKFDLVQTNLTERDIIQASIDYFISVIIDVANQAERMTSFKPTPGGSGGGNRGNFNNRGGGSGGGNYQNNGGQFGGGNNSNSNSNEDNNLYV